jgi:hypothetical protein
VPATAMAAATTIQTARLDFENSIARLLRVFRPRSGEDCNECVVNARSRLSATDDKGLIEIRAASVENRTG